MDHVTEFILINPDEQQAVDMQGRVLRSLVTIGTAVDLTQTPIFTFLTPNIATQVSCVSRIVSISLKMQS